MFVLPTAQVEVLDRPEHAGFARQNNLLPGTWIDLHFGGDVPTIFTGEVSDLEEDMIENGESTSCILIPRLHDRPRLRNRPLRQDELRARNSRLQQQKEQAQRRADEAHAQVQRRFRFA